MAEADTDKRAAAIAALTKALQDYDDTERGVRPGWVDSQVVVAARLALHALDSDGAAMLRELRDWVWAQLAQCRQQRYAPYWNGTIIAFQQVVAEIDLMLAAKPAPEPEPATNGIEYLSPTETRKMPAPFPPEPATDDKSHRPDRSPRLHGSADSTPPEGAASPAAEPAATDEARIAGSPAHVALWDAINAVVCASGGSSSCPNVARMRAVVEVENAVRAIVREFATRTQVVHRRQVTQTGEHFCETQCEERKRLLARAEKAEDERDEAQADAAEYAQLVAERDDLRAMMQMVRMGLGCPDGQSLLEHIDDLRARLALERAKGAANA